MKSNSGKLLIAAMLGAGVLAAGASWWFRFEATHQAALFWGPQAAQLIRDAPHVELLALESAEDLAANDLISVAGASWQVAGSHDISQAPGLTHLRNALLEDRSFVWPARDVPADTKWIHGLRFRDDSGPPLTILFSADYLWATTDSDGAAQTKAVACEPIAAGLQQVFVEWSQRGPRSEETPDVAGER